MRPGRRWVRPVAVAALAATALGVSGCSRPIDGTPVAGPDATGAAVPEADLLATTCRQYQAMNSEARRAVIAAIGEDGNQLVAINPDVWVGVAAALCTFADAGAPVRDVVTGGIR